MYFSQTLDIILRSDFFQPQKSDGLVQYFDSMYGISQSLRQRFLNKKFHNIPFLLLQKDRKQVTQSSNSIFVMKEIQNHCTGTGKGS